MTGRDHCPRQVSGIGIGAGRALGPLHAYGARNTEEVCRTALSREQEYARLRTALEETANRVDGLCKQARREISADAAEIFEIHAMLLQEEDFTQALQQALTTGRTAEDAVTDATELLAAQLRSLSDPYLSARANDLLDLRRQLLDRLSGSTDTEMPTASVPHILVAKDLTPSQTLSLDKSRILGFVTLQGTPGSHTAILARAMGIPALVGVGELPAFAEGCTALLDASRGLLTISPDEATVESFRRSHAAEEEQKRERERQLRTLVGRPAVTKSGHPMLIYANVGDAEEAARAYANGADGVGLLRTELLYLASNRYPTEEELYAAYRDAVTAMKGKRTVIRTLDIGADKQIPYFHLPQEENPALGLRAVRLCLSRETLFRTQLRAILRASAHGRVAIMIPMIVSVEEVRRCHELLQNCMEELEHEGLPFDRQPEFGIMVETPAAAVMGEELAREVDFFSVGTNDLTQYTLAADRQNSALEGLCQSNREPVLRLIEAAADAIHRRGGWIGICGELAAEPSLTQRFADMRIDELSVSVPFLLSMRERVWECQ